MAGPGVVGPTLCECWSRSASRSASRGCHLTCTDHFLRLLHLADGARNNGLEDRPTIVVQQVDFVDDDQSDQLRVRAVAGLAGDDVPLFRRRDDDLCVSPDRVANVSWARESAHIHTHKYTTLGEARTWVSAICALVS